MAEACHYCERPLPEHKNDGRNHFICADEWGRRLSRHICTVCGERECSKQNELCDECGADIDTVKYQGYPPEGA